MYWQRGNNSQVRFPKSENEDFRYPSIKTRQDSLELDEMSTGSRTTRRLRPKSQLQLPHVRGNSSSNSKPTNQNNLSFIGDTKNILKELDVMQSARNNVAASTMPNSAADPVALKKKVISLEIQNETLEQISDLLKHKNEAVESELSYFKRTANGPDKAEEMKRELMLRESEDKRYALQQQIKLMNKQFEKTVHNLLEENKVLTRENKLLRRELGNKQDMEPASKRISELVEFVDELKVVMASKNDEQEKLMHKIEMLEHERGTRLPMDPGYESKRPQEVIDTFRSNYNDDNVRSRGTNGQTSDIAFANAIHEYERSVLLKTKEIEALDAKSRKLQTQIQDAFNLVRAYYRDVVNDPEIRRTIDARVAKSQMLQEKGVFQENNGTNTGQLTEVLQELFMRKAGMEFSVKQEIESTSKKMRELEEEVKRQDVASKGEMKRIKSEYRNTQDRSKELNQINSVLESELHTERTERQRAQRECEQQRADFTKKVKDLNAEIASILTSTETDINKMKIDNYQNQEQNKQLLQLVTNKEREIAQLRYKLVHAEEELAQSRKRALNGTSSQVPAMHNRSINGLENNNNSSFFEGSTLKKKMSSPTKPLVTQRGQIDEPAMTTATLTQRQNPGMMNSISANLDSTNPNNPFMKIKYIRSLKEWAVYWKYYQDNTVNRLHLLEKLMQTESLREKFTQSEELKAKVFRESFESNSPPLSELVTILMADTIDLDRLSKEEIRTMQNGHQIVKNLRTMKIDEDVSDYHNLQISSLKVLSFMDNSNMDWTETMSDELMNVNGLKSLISYVKQDSKEWPKLLSLNVLHMIARKKALINFMVSYDIAQTLMENLENPNLEIQKATIALLVPLLPEEQFINSIKDIKYLMKFIPFIMQDNNTILSNSLQCIAAIIPTFQYQKMLYKTEIIERIASVASTSPYTSTRIQALNLMRKLIEHANEKECEMVNTQGSGMILRNLEIAEGESMREITPLRDVLYRSLKIIRSLIEDFPCPDEHLLCQRIMRLLCDVRIKNDSKIEQVVLEIIHILWDKMEDSMVTNLHDRDVLRSVVDGYMRSTNLQDGINYGLMLVGICEKQTMNGYIVNLRGRELLVRVIQNCHHLDFKTAITATKILSFLAQEPRIFDYLESNDLSEIAKLLKKSETQESFMANSLDIVFHCMKNPPSLRQLIDFDCVESIFGIMDEQVYSVNIMCLEIVHTFYKERDILKEMCIDDEIAGSDIINGISNMCQSKVQKDLGTSSLFFWRFLAKQSASSEILPVIYQRADEMISTFVKLKRSYIGLVPDLSSQISTILQNLSHKSSDLRDIHQKYEQ